MKQLPNHRNLYIGIRDVLLNVFEKKLHTDKALEKKFKANKVWGSRDRAFVAEWSYEMVRWKRKIKYLSGGALAHGNYWHFMGTAFLWQGYKLPNWDEFKGLSIAKIQERESKLDPNSAIAHSVNDEFYEMGKEQLGEAFDHQLQRLNVPAKTILRTNTLKTSRAALMEKLEEEGFENEKVQGYDHAVALIDKPNLFRSESFQNGLFEVQDAHSQKVAEFLDVQPGMRVWDACAGAGGKTLHLAMLMDNKGSITASDVHEWKLQELKKRARRAEAFNITTKPILDNKTLKRMSAYDRILIDAPCTGSGVIRRNPDAKYQINRSFLERVAKVQEEILQDYSKLLKVGGIMVYATCSVLPAENDKQIENFLANNPNFSCLEKKVLLPTEHEFDGFFMAKLKRNE